MYSDNSEFRPLTGLGGGFWTVDLLGNAAYLPLKASAIWIDGALVFVADAGRKR